MFIPYGARALSAACLVGIALACRAPALAADASPSPAPSPTSSAIPEIGRVVTSDRQDEPATATARVTYVVTKADMIRYGYTDVAGAIATLPGVVISRYGAAGAAAGVSIRGDLGDGVLVLLDGHPIVGGEIGAIDLGSIPTAGIERVEVVEGSGSTLYGNGASGGIINIITARSHHAPTDVDISGGSFGDGRFALETPAFSFAREIANNAYGYDLPGLPPETRTNADLSTTNARLTESGTFGDLAIGGSVGFVARVLGVPGSTDYPTLFARQSDDTQDARVSAAYTHGKTTTSLDLTAMRETLDYDDPSVQEFGPTLDFSTDARVQASLRSVTVTDTQRLVYGIDLAHGVARNDGGNGDFASTQFAQTAGYVQDSVLLGTGSRIYAGFRAERDGGAGAAITPELGGIVGLGEGFSLRLNAGTAFRVPTAEDLTYPIYSNPDLLPERTQSFDATFESTRILGGASVGYFVQTGTDLIVLNPNADYSQPFSPANPYLINQQQSSIAGFVFDVATRPLNGFVTTLNLTDTYRALGYAPGTEAQRLVGRPVVAANLNLGYTGSARAVISSLGAVVHVSGASDAGIVGTTPSIGGYTTVDTYVRVRLARNALISLRAFNIGNERYEEISGYPMPGRAFSVSLSTR